MYYSHLGRIRAKRLSFGEFSWTFAAQRLAQMIALTPVSVRRRCLSDAQRILITWCGSCPSTAVVAGRRSQLGHHG